MVYRSSKWLRPVYELIILLCLSIVVGLTVNAVSPAGIPLFGQWDPSKGLVNAGGPCMPDTNQVLESEIASLYLDREIVFVDARTSQDYEDGHIPGAVSLPVGQAEEAIYSFMDNYAVSKPLIVYCSNVDCTDSHDLADILKSYGYENIRLYPQGFAGWTKAGRPVEKGYPDEL